MAHDNLIRARIRAKTWMAANPEGVRVHTRKWRATHPERHRENVRRWHASNPERSREQVHRRRARIARVLATLTPQEWEAILEAAGRACIYCGSRKQITQDHLVPISRGGDHTAENVAPACGPCNSSKGAQAVAEFLAERKS